MDSVFAMNTEAVRIKTRLQGDKEEYEMCLVMYIVFSCSWFQSFPENSLYIKWVFEGDSKVILILRELSQASP